MQVSVIDCWVVEWRVNRLSQTQASLRARPRQWRQHYLVNLLHVTSTRLYTSGHSSSNDFKQSLNCVKYIRPLSFENCVFIDQTRNTDFVNLNLYFLWYLFARYLVVNCLTLFLIRLKILNYNLFSQFRCLQSVLRTLLQLLLQHRFLGLYRK